MNTGDGRMEMLSHDDVLFADKFGMPTFEVGEELEIKGSRFRIHAIQKSGLVLKVLEDQNIKLQYERFLREARP